VNSQVDVHPEDLLDRESAGRLSLEQRKRLDHHTARCASCAVLRPMTAAFASQRAPRAGDEARLARLYESTLGVEVAPGSGYSRSRIGRRLGPVAMGAVILLAGTAATASFWSVRQLFVHRAEPVAAAPMVEPESAPIRPAPRARERIAAPPAVAIAEPEPAPVRPPVRAPATVREAPRPHVTEDSADRLFAEANEARRRGDLASAMKFYQQLQQQYPGSREETTSRVLLGRLLLDRGEDTPAALSLFARYLNASPNGTLAEEARLGKALSLMRLGRRTEERQAWQDLLAAHPATVHARRAEIRLEELR
jgi:TolA-binding protein